MRQIVCGQCGRTFEASSPRRVYCSTACRQRAHRSGTSGPRVLRAKPEPATGPTSVVASTRAELDAVGKSDSAMGAAALALAARIDSGLDTASSLASAVRELRETIAAVVAESPRVASPMDQLRARRDAKRTSA